VVLRDGISGSEAEVCEQNIGARVGNQNVLRLEVPVVDSQAVAVLHGIQDLEEGAPDKSIITHISTLFGDIREQVALRAVFQDNIGAVFVVDNLQHGHYVRVGRGSVVELDLPRLELLLSAVQRLSILVGLAQSLDSVPDAGGVVERRVDDAIRAGPQDPPELEGLSEEYTYP
jgi:hypothetical protein